MAEANAAWKKARTTGQWVKVLGKHAPEMQKEWLALVAAATKRGRTSEKLKHLIWLAVDSVATHLYAPGAVLHAEEALEHGATVAEVMDALRIACLPLTGGLQDGYAILAAALPDAGEPRSAGARHWPEIAGELSPHFKQAFDRFAGSQTPGGLDARSRCLVALAVVSCPATPDREAIRQRIEEALRLGVDAGEILEVMEIASLIGTHAFSLTLDSLADALARHSAK